MSNLGYLRKYLEELELISSLSKNTIVAYQNDIEQLNEWMNIEGLNAIGMDKASARLYLYYLYEQGYSRSTIARKLSSIRRFYTYLEKNKLIKKNVFRQIKTPKPEKRLPIVIGEKHLFEFLNTIEEGSTPLVLRDALIFEMLYGSGLRVSELTAINITDLSQTSFLRVRGKGNKERVVPLNEPIQTKLKAYLTGGRPYLVKIKSEKALFLNFRGTRLTRRGVQYLLDQYIKKGALHFQVSPHSFRHSFATHMLDNGADLRVIQELLGHENLSTTQIYTNISTTRIKNAYNNAHPRAWKCEETK